LSSIEIQVENIMVFQSQALEVHQKLEVEQQSLFSKVDIIQNYFWEASQSLENISFKEKHATTTQSSFQKVVIFLAKEELSVTPRLSVVETIRGDILLKTWEPNIVERKNWPNKLRKIVKRPLMR
jgi:hypothetical protein